MIKFRLHLTLATYCNLLGLHLILQKCCSAELLAQNQCRLYLPQSISSQGGHWLRVPTAQGAIGPWLLVPCAIVGWVRRDIASPLFIRPSAGSAGSPACAPGERARAAAARHLPRHPSRAPAPASPPGPAASSAAAARRQASARRPAGGGSAAASALQGGGGGCPAARSSVVWRRAMASSSSVMQALRGSQSEGVPSSSPNDGPSPLGRPESGSGRPGPARAGSGRGGRAAPLAAPSDKAAAGATPRESPRELAAGSSPKPPPVRTPLSV